MPLTAGMRLGPYEILALIGAGGMGEVWKAHDTRLDRLVAIKQLKGQHGARFEQEARAIAALNHPHICILYDIGPDYLVMEYIDGAPLRGPLPLEDALRFARQIAGALAVAHNKGILHRDLKPANVLIRATDAKLLDFGLAKLTEASGTSTTQTLDGTVVGTAAYMSPEQAQGKTLDERSDVFSFGALLHEMLSGTPAFGGASLLDTLNAVVRDEPAPLHSPAAGIVSRCLAKQPAQRFQSMQEVQTALGGITAKPAGTQPSIAVLPFANMSSNADDEYFSDGLAEEILNVLAHIPGLKVIARTSSFAFRGKEQDITKIAEALRVRTILEGSVRRAASRIRVTAQLIDAADGSHLWSERYDRELTDVFAVQDEIAQAIAAALEVKLTGEPAARRAHQPNLPAYEALLKGRHQMLQRSPEAFALAKEYFEQSSALDPDYAEPHSELAFCFFNIALWSLRPPREVMPLARAEARKALELSPADALAHLILSGVATTFDYDVKEADREYGLAMAAASVPPSVRASAANYLIGNGRFPEAIQTIEAAIDQDPLNVSPRIMLSLTMNHAGMHHRAIEEARKVLEVEPNLWAPHHGIACGYAFLGMYTEARDAEERALALAPWNSMVVGTLAGILSRLGEQERADQLLARVPETAPHGRVIYHMLRSEIDQAADWYEKDIELRQPTAGFAAAAAFLKPLRESPRWPKLAKMMNLSSHPSN